MMEDERFLLTRHGYEQLTAELADREAEKSQRRGQLEAIYHDVDHSNNDEEAADFDVRTMAEFAEERVGHLKFVLERAQVMDEDPDPQHINAGDRVIVWDLGARKERTFNLVNGEEIGTIGNAVAVDSPVGMALMGKAAGDTVAVEVPDGWSRLMVRRVERTDN